MENSGPVLSKNNIGCVVDEVFSLMFETLWVVPYDWRRGNPLLGDFEHCARRVVRLLEAVESTEISDAQVDEIRRQVGSLCASIRRIASAGIFSGMQIAEATAAAERISVAVEGLCVGETRCK